MKYISSWRPLKNLTIELFQHFETLCSGKHQFIWAYQFSILMFQSTEGPLIFYNLQVALNWAVLGLFSTSLFSWKTGEVADRLRMETLKKKHQKVVWKFNDFSIIWLMITSCQQSLDFFPINFLFNMPGACNADLTLRHIKNSYPPDNITRSADIICFLSSFFSFIRWWHSFFEYVVVSNKKVRFE